MSATAPLFEPDPKSKPRKQPPLSAPVLLARLRTRYPKDAYAFMTEVPNGTGGNVSRHADALVMSLWPSRGLDLYGFELKSSRTDWQKELATPAKADAIARYCDYWYLVVGDKDIVRPGELPPTWGLIVPHNNGLKVITEATRLEAVPIGRKFLAALFRAAQNNILPEAQIREIKNTAFTEGSNSAKETYEWQIKQHQERCHLFREQTGIDFSDWNFATIKEAIQIVKTNSLDIHLTRLRQVKTTASQIIKQIEELESTKG